MSAKSPQDERTEAIRSFLRRLIRDRYEGNASACASDVGISKSIVSDVLAGKRSLGVVNLASLADRCGVTIDEIVGRPTLSVSQIDKHPQWHDVLAAARRAHPEIDADYLEAVGAFALPGGLPRRLDVALVASIAAALQAHAVRSRVVSDAEADTTPLPDLPVPHSRTTAHLQTQRTEKVRKAQKQ